MAGVSREYVSRLESGKVALTEEIKGKFTDALDKLNPDNPLEMVLDYVRIRFPTQDVKHVVEDILKLRLGIPVAFTWFVSQKTFDGKKPFGFLKSCMSFLLRPKVTYTGKAIKLKKEKFNPVITAVRSVMYVPD